MTGGGRYNRRGKQAENGGKMRLRCFGLVAAALAAALVAAVPAAAAEFIDSAGRRAILPAQIGRVMAAGPASAVFAYVLTPEKLIGWPEALSPAQRALIQPRYARLPVTGELGGAFPTATAATVTRLHPDLILGYGQITPPTVALADRIQRDTGVPYILLDDSIQVMPALLRQLTPILGAGEHGYAVGTYAFRAIGALRGQLLITPADDRPRVYYGRGADGLEAALPGSPQASAIEQAGVINVARGLGRGALVRITRHELLAWDPQIIIAEDRNFYDSLLHRSEWRGLAAVRAKKVYLAPGRPFGWIDDPPGPNRTLGLYWLSGLFYPNLEQQDIRALARDFYQLYYGIQLTDRQLEALLRGALPPGQNPRLANVPIFGSEPIPMPNPGAGPPPGTAPGRPGLGPKAPAPLLQIPNPPASPDSP
jgi:iron complex transport system substrate-binding protein